MKTIKLPYGKGTLDLNIPEERLAGILESHAHEFKAEKSEAEIVREALENPIDSPRLRELVKGKKKHRYDWPVTIHALFQVKSFFLK